MRAPKRVHLPSGLVLALEPRRDLRPRRRARAAPLFSELLDRVDGGDLVLRDGSRQVDVRTLKLRDFHALRAIAMKLGWLEEEPVEIPCCNCDAPIQIAPCAALALGPFVDGELDDPELDRTLDLSVPHAIPEIPLGGGRVAREVTLVDVDVARATPLHRALRRRRFTVSDRVVRAMGIDALGDQRDATRIAEALARCSDEAWGAVGDLFLDAHYPLRLASIAVCPECGARNDVDAPWEREVEPSGWSAERATSEPRSNAEAFPDFDSFDRRARSIFEALEPREVMLVVEGGVPACDDGGVPLLGSYDPPVDEPGHVSRAARVTVYYRTFGKLRDEDPAYDWTADLRETMEHELEHHDGWLSGHDPMDEAERAEIAREHVRFVGRKAAIRESVGALGADVRGFLARTWPIWLVVAAATITITVCGR